MIRLSKQDIHIGLRSAWLLLRNKHQQCFRALPDTPATARTSFGAMFLLYPVMMLFSYLELSMLFAIRLTPFLLLFTANYVLMWVVPALVIYYAAGFLNLRAGVYRTIAIISWLRMLMMLIMVAITLVGMLGLAPPSVLVIANISIILMLYISVFRSFRIGLGASKTFAFMMLAILMVSQLLHLNMYYQVLMTEVQASIPVDGTAAPSADIPQPTEASPTPPPFT
jgi:hypothetical protein